jgi:non-specific serine/threonine protein kinase
VAEEQGDLPRAREHFQRALTIKREVGDRLGLAGSLSSLSTLARLAGEHRSAVALVDEAVALERELGSPSGLAYRLYVLCLAAGAAGDLPRAGAAGLEALALERGQGAGESIARRLERLAEVVLGAGGADAPRRAARLLGAAATLREAIGAPPRNPEGYRRRIEAVRRTLTPGAFARARAAGRALTPEQALAGALAPAIQERRAG